MMNKKPSIVYWLGDSVYLNLTNRCSNNCYFCVRNFRYGLDNFNLTLDREPDIDEVINELNSVLKRRSWQEVVFCGFGEPLERLDCIIEVSKLIKKNHKLPIRINTNGHGYLLNKERKVIEELKDTAIDKLSVSLNAHDKNVYNRISKPVFEDAFDHVLDFIEKARNIIDTEITAVALPEVDLQKIEEYANKIGASFRRREYYSPIW